MTTKFRVWTICGTAGLMNHGDPQDIVLDGRDKPQLKPNEKVNVIEHAALEECQRELDVANVKLEHLRSLRKIEGDDLDRYVKESQELISSLREEIQALRKDLKRLCEQSSQDEHLWLYDSNAIRDARNEGEK